MKTLRLSITFIILNSVFIVGNAQWASGGPQYPLNSGNNEAQITSIVVSGSNMFAATNDNGIYVSSNEGSSWATANTGLTDSAIECLALVSNGILAGSYDKGMFISTNDGASWSAANTGLPANSWISALATNGNVAFAGLSNQQNTDGAIYRSQNNGQSWQAVTTGLPNSEVKALAINNGTIYAGIYGYGVYISTDNGNTWTGKNTGIDTDYMITSFAFSGTDIFAGSIAGVYYSNDSGRYWNLENNLHGLAVSAVFVMENKLYAGGQYGSGPNNFSGDVYSTPLDGLFWWTETAFPQDQNNPSAIDAFAVINYTLYAGMYGNGVWQETLPDDTTCHSHFTLYADSTTPHHWYALNQATSVADLTYSWNWGDNSSPSDGPTPSHTYADSGYYNICLTIYDANSCQNTYCDSNAYIRSVQSTMVTVDVVTTLPTGTGIPQMGYPASSISIYPNPNSTGHWQLTVSNELVGSALAVYDEQGRLILKDEIRSLPTGQAGAKYELNLDVTSGLYFLEIKSADNTIVRTRFVKL